MVMILPGPTHPSVPFPDALGAPPDLTELRMLAAHLEVHADRLDASAVALGAAVAAVTWLSEAGNLARTRFERSVASLRGDAGSVRAAADAVRRHVQGVDAVAQAHRAAGLVRAAERPQAVSLGPAAGK